MRSRHPTTIQKLTPAVYAPFAMLAGMQLDLFRSWSALLCVLPLMNVLGLVISVSAHALPPLCGSTELSGVLRVSSVNPRYFTNDCGKAIYMTGSHTWNNFPDMDDVYPPENQPFDFDRYLDFLDQFNHNFIRLWVWEGPYPNNASYYPRRIWASPQPWRRTGPGTAIDGLPKFDLTQWNQSYFDRLRQRVQLAQSRGKFVSVMLFECWELQFAEGKLSHPFNSANNINGIGFGSTVTNIHTLRVPDITTLQEEYVRRVIDAVNDADNVLYEICNEGGAYSTSWQLHMINFVKQYEAGKAKQHPLGMTYQYPDGSNATLFNSAAEWISPRGTAAEPYDSDPPANDGRKVVFNDTDHIGGSGFGDRNWVWKSFMRGLNTLFMDRYENPDSIAWGPIGNAEQIRRAMGDTRAYALRMDLAHTVPDVKMASTRYALVNARECLVYSPSSELFTVNLRSYTGSLSVEWFNPATRQTLTEPPVPGGTTRTFVSPVGWPAVLYLYLR